jgi:hypothetical protein
MQVVPDSNEFLFAFLAKKKECILVLRRVGGEGL